MRDQKEVRKEKHLHRCVTELFHCGIWAQSHWAHPREQVEGISELPSGGGGLDIDPLIPLPHWLEATFGDINIPDSGLLVLYTTPLGLEKHSRGKMLVWREG